MYAIFKKELNAFFSSPTGYVIIAIYLIINGLFLWFFENNFNILRAGFADLSSYFFIAPWIFLFLIPAITMKSFSEEITSGTIEILKTKPLSDLQIVLGKFFSSLVLSVIAIIPTLIYVYSVYQLGSPVGNIDLGTTFGSFVGLLFLTSSYTAIGVFSSVLSKNQVVSFLIALSLCFVFFYGFEAVSTYGLVGDFDYFIKKIGLYEHFKGIEKGILDTRSLVYFTSVTVLFIMLTVFYLQKTPKFFTKSVVVIGLLGVVLLCSNSFYKRFDLTKNKRYTLSETSKNTLSKINKNVFVTVFLKGDFPAEFKRLQTETEQFLEELKTENSHIHYKFISPKGQEKELISKGLIPSRLQIMENGDFSELLIFPWAVIEYQNKTETVSLLKETGASSENEQLEKSIQNLEYAFTDGLHKVISQKSKKVAVIKGNGELEDYYLIDFLKTIRGYYHIAPFTLDSVAKQPQKTLQYLSKYDAIIIAKPTEKFTEKEKYTLDQYICNGGKSLWLMDQIKVASDSLYTKGETLAYPVDLGLTDLLFSYGVRINHHLVTDENSAKVPLSAGNLGGKTQYRFFNWKYLPLLTSEENHLINTNIAPSVIKYGNSIDTLKNKAIKKTVLLKSSSLSQAVGTPKIISLEEIKNQTSVNSSKKERFIAVLLEGAFTSAYQGRVPPFRYPTTKSKESKMVVIADGDFIANEMKNGNPVPLDTDKWSGRYYGNKAFLVNVMNYLLDDKGLVKIRSKKVKIPFLNKQRAYKESSYWRFINIVLPLLLLGVFGLIYSFVRKWKYGRR